MIGTWKARPVPPGPSRTAESGTDDCEASLRADVEHAIEKERLDRETYAGYALGIFASDRSRWHALASEPGPTSIHDAFVAWEAEGDLRGAQLLWLERQAGAAAEADDEDQGMCSDAESDTTVDLTGAGHERPSGELEPGGAGACGRLAADPDLLEEARIHWFCLRVLRNLECQARARAANCENSKVAAQELEYALRVSGHASEGGQPTRDWEAAAELVADYGGAPGDGDGYEPRADLTEFGTDLETVGRGALDEYKAKAVGVFRVGEEAQASLRAGRAEPSSIRRARSSHPRAPTRAVRANEALLAVKRAKALLKMYKRPKAEAAADDPEWRLTSYPNPPPMEAGIRVFSEAAVSGLSENYGRFRGGQPEGTMPPYKRRAADLPTIEDAVELFTLAEDQAVSFHVLATALLQEKRLRGVNASGMMAEQVEQVRGILRGDSTPLRGDARLLKRRDRSGA